MGTKVDPPRGFALRLGRVDEPRVYLVTSVTRNRKPVFLDFGRGRLLVRELRREDTAGRAATLAYVVMPDHFHWLLRLGEAATLGEVVRAVKGRSARSVHGDTVRGSLWQRGFHDHAVRREENLLAVARYVLANPLRAGLVRSLRDYPLWDAVWLERGVVAASASLEESRLKPLLPS